MSTTKLFTVLAVSASLVFAGAGCTQTGNTNNANSAYSNQNTNSEKEAYEVDEEFEMVLGQEVEIEDAEMTVEFSDVVSDSRCAEGVNCITAGKTEVEFTVTTDDEDSETVNAVFDASLEEQEPVIVGDYSIMVSAVEPEMQDGEEIEDADYMVMVSVSEAEQADEDEESDEEADEEETTDEDEIDEEDEDTEEEDDNTNSGY